MIYYHKCHVKIRKNICNIWCKKNQIKKSEPNPKDMTKGQKYAGDEDDDEDNAGNGQPYNQGNQPHK